MSDESRTQVDDRPEEARTSGGETRDRAEEPAQDRSDELDIFAAPPDDRNPAILDARKTYIITILGSVLFCGAVVVFLLL